MCLWVITLVPSLLWHHCQGTKLLTDSKLQLWGISTPKPTLCAPSVWIASVQLCDSVGQVKKVVLILHLPISLVPRHIHDGKSLVTHHTAFHVRWAEWSTMTKHIQRIVPAANVDCQQQSVLWSFLYASTHLANEPLRRQQRVISSNKYSRSYARCKRRNIPVCVSSTRFYSVLQSDWCHQFTGQWHEKRVVCYQTLSNKNGGWVRVRDYIPTAEEDLCGRNILQSVVTWYCYVRNCSQSIHLHWRV